MKWTPEDGGDITKKEGCEAPDHGGGCREQVTVASVLSLLDSGNKDDAWKLLRDKATVLHAGADGDDDVHETLLRAFRDDAAALRRANPATRVRAWLAGVRRHLRRESARTNIPLSAKPALASRDRTAPNTPLGWTDVDLSMLTDKQREVLRLRAAGVSEREIGLCLQITRGSVRDRLERAILRIRKHAREPADDRSWALAILAAGDLPPGRLPADGMRAILRLHHRGVSGDEIARATGATTSSVKSRLKRWRRWWSQGPAA